MPKFGIEIECFNLPTVPSEIFAMGWSDHGDGSIQGRNSREIVSPPLMANETSYREVKKVMKLLREAGGRVNRSCGLHVHVEVERAVRGGMNYGKFFETLVHRYETLEPYFDTLVPPSRRDDENEYCQNMESLRSEIDCCDLQEIFSHDFELSQAADLFEQMDRYFKLNITSFVRHGTVEFRHFGGTLNGTKAVAWVRTCVAFMEAAREHSKIVLEHRMTTEEWNNPFFMVDNEQAISYLKARHEEAINPSVVPAEENATA